MTQSEVRKMFIKAYPGVRLRGRKGYWYRCACCGRWCGRAGGEHAYIQEYEKMEVDHIKPWSHGGSDDLWNLQPLCKPCNRSKSANPSFKDSCKTAVNTVAHPLDSVASIGRKAFRQNKVLKVLGINKRR